MTPGTSDWFSIQYFTSPKLTLRKTRPKGLPSGSEELPSRDRFSRTVTVIMPFTSEQRVKAPTEQRTVQCGAWDEQKCWP